MFLQQVINILAVKFTEVQNADFTLEGCHIVNHFLGLGFTNGKFVIVNVITLHQVHEGLDRKGVVLGRNSELLLFLFGLAVVFQNGFVMVVQLVCLSHEIFTFGGKSHAAAGAVKDYDADFIFQVVDGGSEGRLGNKQSLGGLIEGTHLGDTDCVA